MNEITSAPLISDVQRPERFSDRGSLAHSSENPSLTPTDLEKLDYIDRVLGSDELAELIDQGCVTFAMIKPDIAGANGLPENDDEASEIIKDQIGRKRIMLDLPIWFDEEDTEAFYGHVKELLHEKGKDRAWKEMSEYTTSGPMNLLLLYFEDGDAVSKWRDMMGPTYPEKAREEAPESIRGRWGQEVPRNIVHGSDSIESVHREIGIIRNNLKKLRTSA